MMQLHWENRSENKLQYYCIFLNELTHEGRFMTNCGANIDALNNIKVVYMNIEKKL